MLELELTYLVKELPHNLADLPHKELIDLYIPQSSVHPTLRIRKNGEKYEITKKEPTHDGDASRQLEQTITLTAEEYAALARVNAKKVAKIRYFYDYQGRQGEIDVFQEGLSGLVLADFEFDTEEEKAAFSLPDFCLAEVTQETFVAGGMLCGKCYEDIEKELERFNYRRLSVG